MEGGYLKLWRMARQDPLLRSLPGEQFKATWGLLCCVNWKAGEYMCPKCGELVEIPEGATVKSVRTLADEGFGVALTTMHRTITRLCRSRFLVRIQSAKCHTVYLVRNWAKYQDSGTPTERGRNADGTRAEQIEEGLTGEAGKKKNTRQASAEALSAAASLGRAIVTWKRDHKLAGMAPAQKKSWVEKQAVHLDRMVALDKRTWGRIAEVLRWLPTNEFWAPNILSGAKLREKFDKLEAKMRPSARVDAEKQLLIDSIDKGYS